MQSVKKEYFEEILASAARNQIVEFSREEAEELIDKYFPRKEFISKTEVAVLLGCSLRQIDYLRENHGLPWFMLGNRIRFNVRDVRQWILENRRQGSGSVPSMAYKRKK